MSDRKNIYSKYIRLLEFEIKTLQHVIQLTGENYKIGKRPSSSEIISINILAEKRLKKLNRIQKSDYDQILKEASKLFPTLKTRAPVKPAPVHDP